MNYTCPSLLCLPGRSFRPPLTAKPLNAPTYLNCLAAPGLSPRPTGTANGTASTTRYALS